jgi:DNA transformation protein
MGADEAYARLLASGERAHFIAFYVLVMALQGRPWNDAKGAEKIALRARFDGICAAHDGQLKGRPEKLEAALNLLGVIPSARLQPTSSRPEKK